MGEVRRILPSVAFAVFACAAGASDDVPGNHRFRVDFSKVKVTNYKDLLTIRTVGTDADACLQVSMTNRTQDTAWCVVSGDFEVTPGAEFAIVLKARGNATTLLNPMGRDFRPCVFWLDADGRELKAQDAKGATVPAVFDFAFPSRGEDWIASASQGTVPAAARRARIRIGADTPTPSQGERVEISDVVFTERVPGGDWTFRVSRIPDVRDTVGKQDFSAFRRPASTNGVMGIRDDGMHLVDGKPIFLLGVSSVRKNDRNGKSFEKALRELKSIGCNLAHNYVQSEEEFDEFVDACEKTGMVATMEPALRNAKGEERTRQIIRRVESVRNRGVIAQWVVGDDTADHRTPEEVMYEHMLLHALDDSCVTVSVDGLPYETRYYPYVHACDACRTELYPYRAETPEPDALARLVNGNDVALSDMRRAGASGKGLAATLQAFSGWTAWKRYPTKAEIRAQSFAAIATGSRGLEYYSYYSYDRRNLCIATTERNFAEFAEVTREIAALMPDLVQRDAKVQPAVRILSGPEKAPLGKPAVVRLLKESETGEPLLVAVNIAPEPVEATFAVGADYASAGVLSENRRIAVADGAFADRFEPSAVHLYRLVK